MQESQIGVCCHMVDGFNHMSHRTTATFMSHALNHWYNCYPKW